MAKGDVTTGTPGIGRQRQKPMKDLYYGDERDNEGPTIFQKPVMGGKFPMQNKGINPGGLYGGMGQGFQMPNFGQINPNRKQY